MVVRFRHDRVQQAATSRLAAERLRVLHLTLARRLVNHPEFVGLAAEQYLHVPEDMVGLEERRRVFECFERRRPLRLVNPR